MSQFTPSSHRFNRYYRKIEPLFQSREAQAYTMISLSLLCIAFFSIFAIRPTISTISVLQKKIGDETELNSQLESKINSLIAAQQSYEKIQPDLPLVYSLLPDQPEFPSLLRSLENIAIDNQATLSGLQFEPILLYQQTASTSAATSSAKLVPVKFNLSFGGPYPNLVAILDKLTKLDRLVTIYSVNFNVATNDQAKSVLNVSVGSSAYYY